MKNKLLSVFSILAYISQFIPFFLIKSHHSCEYENCIRLCYNDIYGVCIQKHIDDLYWIISILWLFVFTGTCIVFSQKVRSISPFVIIAMIIAISIWGAFIDPSKWMFAIFLTLSAAFLIIASIIDYKKTNRNIN